MLVCFKGINTHTCVKGVTSVIIVAEAVSHPPADAHDLTSLHSLTPGAPADREGPGVRWPASPPPAVCLQACDSTSLGVSVLRVREK